MQQNMLKIEGGDFIMGSEGWGPFESPAHTVRVSSFLMDETLVTNSDFSDFIKDTKYITDAEKIGGAWNLKNGKYQTVAGLHWQSFANPHRMDHPVVLISWNDANAFAVWKGKRLPTEAEWEFAARGGLTDHLYPWGNVEPEGKCNWNQVPSEIPSTCRVKSFQANQYGLYDMVGNTWQWVNDWYGEDYYSQSPQQDPLGPDSGQLKVRRGASFNVIQAFRLRCANRGAFEPSSYAINIGFRCAKSLSDE